jgi:hypothetical protein
MKFCKDCKHYHDSVAVWGLYMPATCHGGEVTLNPVDGRKSTYAGDCADVRGDRMRCGISAVWFKPATLDGRLAALEESDSDR